MRWVTFFDSSTRHKWFSIWVFMFPMVCIVLYLFIIQFRFIIVACFLLFVAGSLCFVYYFEVFNLFYDYVCVFDCFAMPCHRPGQHAGSGGGARPWPSGAGAKPVPRVQFPCLATCWRIQLAGGLLVSQLNVVLLCLYGVSGF